MNRTLYLHIGAHRTATTSIQQFLRQNFFALQKMGYLNPFAAGRNVTLFNKIFAGEQDIDDLANDLNDRADAKKFPIHSFILSDEDICMREDLTPLARFSDHFNVKVLFSLRRQDLWLESWHQQNVKWQWNPALSHLTFPEFLERRQDFHWIHYDRLTQKLANLFGAENVTLRVFERQQMTGGPIGSFCQDINLSDTTGFTEPPHVNSSLAPLTSELMRSLPLDKIPANRRRIIEMACTALDPKLSEMAGNGSRLLMDLPTRQAILDDYSQGNKAVANEWFGRDTLFFDGLPATTEPVARQTLPTDSYALLEQVVGPLIHEIMNRFEPEAETNDGAQPQKSKAN